MHEQLVVTGTKNKSFHCETRHGNAGHIPSMYMETQNTAVSAKCRENQGNMEAIWRRIQLFQISSLNYI